ncbi:hypothetical protein Xbud_03520 [Xenorhabdus budapestensis]|uniref:Uncharacterized protein n=1 Tax=Xenorhabdus budapestensis TaxID=290110 RepID=A0A2D0IPJ6_XENBU|nr:hypothetical protein Xbud_03520 [Xenorhabdus budapestensis]
MGFASSMYGPKIRELKHYIMQKELSDTSLQIEPLMQNVTTENALTMQFIGRTTLRVESDGRGVAIINNILRTMGCRDIPEELLNGLEVIIKPKKNRDIKQITTQIIERQGDAFSDIHIKAREEMADILTEFYLSGKGQISANLHKVSNAEIAEEIHNCFVRMRSAIMRSFNQAISNGLR